MGHPILEIDQAERDGGGDHRDLDHDVVEPVTREWGVGTFDRFTLPVVVPSFLSSSSTPSAAISSRMRSAALKFLALRAACRASIRFATLVSSIASEAGRQVAHSAAVSCIRPIICALALRHAMAPGE